MTLTLIIAIVYLVGAIVSHIYAVHSWRKFHERLHEKYPLGGALEKPLPWGIIGVSAALSWVGLITTFASFPPWER